MKDFWSNGDLLRRYKLLHDISEGSEPVLEVWKFFVFQILSNFFVLVKMRQFF